MWWSAQQRALCTKISEVNISAFIYRLFHEDFSSSIVGINTVPCTVLIPTIEENSL